MAIPIPVFVRTFRLLCDLGPDAVRELVKQSQPSANETRGRGRPPVYVGYEKKHIIDLIRQHGLTGAQRVLAAEGKRVPTLPMMVAWAKENGITVRKGRPPKVIVAQQ